MSTAERTALHPHPDADAVWMGDNEKRGLSFYAKKGPPNVGPWYDSVFVDIVGLWNDTVGVKAWGWRLARSIGGHIFSGSNADRQEAISLGIKTL